MHVYLKELNQMRLQSNYAGGIPLRLDTDVHSVVKVKMSTAL